MRALYVASVWLHMMAATVWLGGMLFLVLILVPVLRRREYEGIASGLIHRIGVRFRWVGWICLGLLLASGTLNLAYRGFGWEDIWSGRLWEGPFGRALGVKLFLVAIILVLSALHDFVVGPRATAMWQEDPAAETARRLRRTASWIGRLNLILALVVVLLGVLLVRGGL